jgi:predicted nucleic acid-binding protein
LSIYADTSFLVSLYTLDANSAAAARFMRGARLPLLITPLGDLELLNALHLRIFRRELSAVVIKSAASLFRADTGAGVFALRSLPLSAFERAKRIARDQTPSMGTRTIDVLHVASALVLRADTFCTFDKHQRLLAKAEGLVTPV